ncbi:MAG: nucleotidyl transferase AbiEii/AbiGii toxin family protein [Gammaproteobacteria bacterium]|nr:nucleotidyl transferase AbiEii/AbiGii toxin family protein [Gammaproteobacteria bacterium]
MKDTCVNVTGKLPSGLVELFTDIDKHAEASAIEYLVVGAMARDLVLVHGFGSNIERGTRDVDFGINVASWDEFGALIDSLLQAGYQQDKRKVHRLTCEDEEGRAWEIDIIPFGKIADESNNIHWLPDQGFEMKIHGFMEAVEHALDVQISEEPAIVIPVASPVGTCLLKLVSWLDREVELRAKDATDFSYLVQSYPKIPEIFNSLYEDDYMETQEWDEFRASSMKLGKDVAMIASRETTEFLKEELFNRPARTEQFVRDMHGHDEKDLEQCAGWFETFAEAFLEGGPPVNLPGMKAENPITLFQGKVIKNAGHGVLAFVHSTSTSSAWSCSRLPDKSRLLNAIYGVPLPLKPGVTVSGVLRQSHVPGWAAWRLSGPFQES